VEPNQAAAMIGPVLGYLDFLMRPSFM